MRRIHVKEHLKTIVPVILTGTLLLSVTAYADGSEISSHGVITDEFGNVRIRSYLTFRS